MGSRERNTRIAFTEKQINGGVSTFELINPLQSLVVMQDQLGNEWDAFRRAVSGPNAAEQMETANAFGGMFFSWVHSADCLRFTRHNKPELNAV